LAAPGEDKLQVFNDFLINFFLRTWRLLARISFRSTIISQQLFP